MFENRRTFLQTAGLVALSAIARSTERAAGTLSLKSPEGVFTPVEAKSFTLRLKAELSKSGSSADILTIPGILSVRLRRHDPKDRKRQNYPAFKMSDGSVPVLEATLQIRSEEHPDWREMTIGIPLAMLNRPAGMHEISLRFSGARWSLYVDGEMLDNDFPFGYPPWAGHHAWKLNPSFVESAAIHFPGEPLAATDSLKPVASSEIQYWLPPGHNSWVGDVVTLYHAGRYHLFYLYDRRHHQSKFGKGAHYFEHLSTLDFKTWTQHPAATPIEEQWECIGTGTPFVFHGKLHLSYGLHTGRVYPEEKTNWPAQWEYLKKNGRTGSFARASTPGVPAGATYSVSADGVSRFQKSNVVFHPCQNPSVYIDPAGKLRMLANAGSNGIWESDSIEGGWRCVNTGFPPGGDCTFFFRWGKFDYIIGGFKGFWSKPAGAPDTEYSDVAGQGLDFYDGSNVPSISEVSGGRFVMAAWIPIRGWGGNLLLRELRQFADGRIGSKWMDEVMPAVGGAKVLTGTVGETASFPTEKSVLLVFDAEPKQASFGMFSVSFLAGEEEGESCELQINLKESRAQFAGAAEDGFAGRQKSLREGGSPQDAGNYAIENLIGAGDRFPVRILVKHSDKLGGSLIDAEIAGSRTMISYRPELAVKQLRFRTHGVTLKNVRVSPLVS